MNIQIISQSDERSLKYGQYTVINVACDRLICACQKVITKIVIVYGARVISNVLNNKVGVPEELLQHILPCMVQTKVRLRPITRSLV